MSRHNQTKRKKLIVKQTSGAEAMKGDYKVDRLINLIHPKVNSYLTEEMLEIYVDDANINVEVAPNRDFRR